MAFVLDASIAMSWALDDEFAGQSHVAWERLTAALEEVHVPGLWWMELRNALIVNERRKRITPAKTARFLSALSRMHILLDHATEEPVLMSFARDHELTVYDAAYLELAQRLGLAIATFDKALARAAARVGVPLLE